MRIRGEALPQKDIRSAPSVVGDVIVSHENVTALGRYAEVATLLSGKGGNSHPVPLLYDCRLAHMGTMGFVLSGLELEGPVAYAQAWWCRPD